ncbi:hypothetical protein [Pseudomonas putida]|uniref:hypothetical protein n=1 Tax=Pseudomonas putida TaxID=303 RepID=UPI00300F667F
MKIMATSPRLSCYCSNTAHAHEQITPEQLAGIAGVSLRSLYSGFREFLGVSPMQYLRDLRVENVREEVVNGEATNVAGAPCAGASLIWDVSLPSTNSDMEKHPDKLSGEPEFQRSRTFDCRPLYRAPGKLKKSL